MKKTIICALISAFIFASCSNEKKEESTMNNKIENGVEVAEMFTSTGDELKIIAVITLEEGAINYLLPHYKELIAASQAEEGCLYYDLHKDVNDTTDTKYMMVELWKNQAAIDAHNAMPHMAVFKTAAEGKVKSTEVSILNLVNP